MFGRCTAALTALLLLISSQAGAAQIRVAVASNFVETARALADRFEAKTGHHVILSTGSTGKHFAQINHGAPFDVFLAADSRRPRMLEEVGLALAGSRFTYAIGQLVLWSPQGDTVPSNEREFGDLSFKRLAIANPSLAPYGRAAREMLTTLGQWHRVQGRLVRGENISQAFHFVNSGNAELGLVAYAQLKRPGKTIEGSFWVVPQSLYSPIEQQAVLLSDKPAAADFLVFIRGEQSQALIREQGYLSAQLIDSPASDWALPENRANLSAEAGQ